MYENIFYLRKERRTILKPKILLLSNSTLFHFSFCSLFKNKFDVHPLMMRYLNKNLNSQTEHFYIQLQEQKRKKMYKSGIIADSNRLLLTNKYIEKIIQECNEKPYERIVFEICCGSKQELLLLKKLTQLNIPVSVFTSFMEQEYLNELYQCRVDSLFQLTDLFSFKHRVE